MQVDQKYCVNEYWSGVMRRDRVTIDRADLSEREKTSIRLGNTVSKPSRCRTCTQRFIPIKYDTIR
jgi:hypothetical protein